MFCNQRFMVDNKTRDLEMTYASYSYESFWPEGLEICLVLSDEQSCDWEKHVRSL